MNFWVTSISRKGALSVAALVLLAASTAAVAQSSGSGHLIFTDPTTRQALLDDPVLTTLMGQKTVDMIEAFMPGINDAKRLLEPAQRSALSSLQRRMKDELGILSFVWIGLPEDLQRATAENVRLVRDREDGKEALIFLYTPEAARNAILSSGPLAARIGGREAAVDLLRFAVPSEEFNKSPGAGIVSQTAGVLQRLSALSNSRPAIAPGASPQVSLTRPLEQSSGMAPLTTKRPGAMHTSAETAPAAAPPDRVTPLEPRELLTMALAASLGGLAVGLIVSIIQSRRRRFRSRSMSNHFVVSAEAAAPIASSEGLGTMDFSRLSASMPHADSTVEDRLILAQTRLVELRESAKQLQATVNASTMDLITHIEAEVEELEHLRRALQG